MSTAKKTDDIRIARYEPSRDKGAWDDFVRQAKNSHFMFFRNYMDYHSDRFKDHSLLFYKDDKLLAVLPASEHGDELRSHGGLTYGGFLSGESMKQGKMMECFSLLRQYLRENNFSRMIYKCIPSIYHQIPAEEDRYALFRNQAKLLKIEPATVIDLMNHTKMSKIRIRQTHRAEREGVSCIRSFDFDRFFELGNEVLKNRHQVHAVHTAGEMRLLQNRFPQNIELYLAVQNDELLAGTLVFITEKAVHTQYLASGETGRKTGALDLLISTLIEHFRSGKVYFDFGISTESDGQILNEGLIYQKEGFGGRTIAYETWEITGV